MSDKPETTEKGGLLRWRGAFAKPVETTGDDHPWQYEPQGRRADDPKAAGCGEDGCGMSRACCRPDCPIEMIEARNGAWCWRSKTIAEWQPIETAPKDGSKVLLLGVKGEREVGRWSSLLGNWLSCGAWFEPNDWLGSSSGSAKKDDLISTMPPTPPPAPPHP